MEITVPILDFSDAIAPINADAMRNARLFSSRHEMIKALPKNQDVVEVGVAYGDFSVDLVTELMPRKFIGIDHFGLEKFPLVWGKNPRETLGDLTHEVYYKNRMQKLSNDLDFEYVHMAGPSAKMVLQSDGFDFAYIDAGHSYEDVELDTRAVIRKLRDKGNIFFNDYIWRDTFNGGLYGVVRTVNQLVNEGGWEVKGLSLNPMMFCDIWIQKH
jgi:hypothetical protein